MPQDVSEDLPGLLVDHGLGGYDLSGDTDSDLLQRPQSLDEFLKGQPASVLKPTSDRKSSEHHRQMRLDRVGTVMEDETRSQIVF